ncbi:hypothetical protein H9P43_002311 [Blastocladiella emersonii ATCC 22665]|nr:hypothetical protein H9P43_002311 [Blastocladiella emersonii ATCC 22665]
MMLDSSTLERGSSNSISAKPALGADVPTASPTWISAWWTAKLPVYEFSQVPGYLQDNKYILTGYRSGYTHAQAWRSIVYIHNETGNIWTHLVGLLLFAPMIACTRLVLPANAVVWGHIVLVAFLLSACKCFLFSTLYHTHLCRDYATYIRFGCLDYAGISILIGGASSVITYCAYYCDASLRSMYLSLTVGLSLIGVVGPLFPAWPTTRFRPWRTLIYVGSGIFSVLPIVHFVAANGLPDGIPWWAAYGWLVVAGLNLCGATIYAFKLPERWFPGKFDVLLHSHQAWHLCILAAALVHAYSAVDLIRWRVACQCGGN